MVGYYERHPKLILHRMETRASIPIEGDGKHGSPGIPAVYNTSPQLEPIRRLTGETLVEASTQLSTSPHSTRSPRLVPSSRTSSLASIPELPPNILGDLRQHSDSSRRPSSRTSSTIQGPVMELLRSHGHQSSGGLAQTALDGTNTAGEFTIGSRSPMGTYSMSPGRIVTLLVARFFDTIPLCHC